jgi:hypothetical protein
MANGNVLGFDAGQWHPVPLPAPSQTLPAAETFGTAGVLGGSATQFARADHVHPMPPDPVPPHNVRADGHRNLRLGDTAIPEPATSDVRGTAEHNIVVGLQRVPVANTPLGTGQNGFVLTYQAAANEWAPQPAAAGARGDFVEHPPDVGHYVIVAAGILDVRARSVAPTYNRLRIVNQNANLLIYGVQNATDPVLGYIPTPPGRHAYVVKGTSLGRTPTLLHVSEFSPQGISVQFVPIGGAGEVERMMIEISLFFE